MSLFAQWGGTPHAMQPKQELALQVEANDGESPRPRRFKITIKWAATVNIQALVDFVRYVLCSQNPRNLLSPPAKIQQRMLHIFIAWLGTSVCVHRCIATPCTD